MIPKFRQWIPFCLFLGGTFKIVIDIAKKKVQTFLNSTMFRGSYGPPPIEVRRGDYYCC